MVFIRCRTSSYMAPALAAGGAREGYRVCGGGVKGSANAAPVAGGRAVRVYALPRA